MNVPNNAQVARARKNITERLVPLSEMAAFWEMEPETLRAAVTGETHADVAEPPPVSASEIMAAEPIVPTKLHRGKGETLIDPATAIPPIETDDGKICGVPGCGRVHAAWGFCDAHLHRVIRDGDPLVDIPIAPWRKPEGENTCKEEGCGRPVVERRPRATYRGWGGRCRNCARRFREAERRETAQKREVIFA